jgi:glycosyltransferase involved in cell wall biosynthesis
MHDMRRELRVHMTVLGRKGGMDRIADLITATVEEHPEWRINVTRLTTRGSGGILRGSLIFLAAAARLWLDGRQGRVDVLHLHVAAHGSAYRKLILASLARHLRIPYVVHLHGSRFHEFWPSLGPRARRAVDGLFRRSARILVLGRVWAQLVGDNVPDARGRITVFPNATKPMSGCRPPSGERPVQISCLGLLGARKGTPQLIDALAQLAGCAGWTATIAGNGDVTASREQARKLGIAERVEIPGWLDEAGADALLRRTDILALPSFAENLPMTILEGFACGVAVVTTPVGAIPEVVEHERNGLIVPLSDVGALASSMRRLIEDPALRHRLGAAARRDHSVRYDINGYVRRLVAIWREAVQPARCEAAAVSPAGAEEDLKNPLT